MGELLGQSLKTEEWVKQFNLTTFVETGCYKGSALEYAQSLGLKLFSCDINDDYVKDCKEKFPESTILVGESTNCFKEMLPQIKEPTLFWLDAHLPQAYGRPWLFTDENHCPAFDELQIIKELKNNYNKDVIIIDDTRNIEAKDNPFFAAGGLPMFVTPGVGHLLQDYIDTFKETHEVNHILEGTGSLVFLPRFYIYEMQT